jgi:hypothetical protein
MNPTKNMPGKNINTDHNYVNNGGHVALHIALYGKPPLMNWRF